MRTNIELNDDLLAEARKYSRAKNRKVLVEEALSVCVTVRAEERRRLTYKERLDRLRTRTQAVRLTSNTRDILRQNRDSRCAWLP